MSVITPQRLHERDHRPEVAMKDCWDCQRGWAVCRTKRRYDSVQEAQQHAMEVSIASDWKRPLVCYRCPYCTLWHTTTARTPARRKRAERNRRKWLIEQRRSATDC